MPELIYVDRNSGFQGAFADRKRTVAYDEDVDVPMAEPVPAGNDLGVEDVLRSSNTKRSSEVPVEELEREMQRERGGVASCMVSVHNCESENDVYAPRKLCCSSISGFGSCFFAFRAD